MSTTWQDATKFDPDTERPQMIDVICEAYPELPRKAVDQSITMVTSRDSRRGRTLCALLIAKHALAHKFDIKVTG